MHPLDRLQHLLPFTIHREKLISTDSLHLKRTDYGKIVLVWVEIPRTVSCGQLSWITGHPIECFLYCLIVCIRQFPAYSLRSQSRKPIGRLSQWRDTPYQAPTRNTSPMKKERRKYPRISQKIPVTIFGVLYNRVGHTVNLCKTGCEIAVTGAGPKRGNQLHLLLDAPTIDNPSRSNSRLSDGVPVIILASNSSV